MGWFWWRKPKPQPEPPVLWKQTEREWVWMVCITERDQQGRILRTITLPCDSAETAADLQSKFCANKDRNFSNSVVRQTIIKDAEEVAVWPL